MVVVNVLLVQCLFIKIVGDKSLEQRMNIKCLVKLGKNPVTFSECNSKFVEGNSE